MKIEELKDGIRIICNDTLDGCMTRTGNREK